MNILSQTKYTEAILSNGTCKLLRFEITKMLLQFKKKFIVSFIIMFGTLWFPIDITTSVQTERVRKASSGVA